MFIPFIWPLAESLVDVEWSSRTEASEPVKYGSRE